MATAHTNSAALDPFGDQIEVRQNVSWADFAAFCASKRNAQRVAYLDGELEIMSPGRTHERATWRLGFLLSHYLRALAIEHEVTGAWLQHVEALGIGIEPDSSFVFGDLLREDHCDLAIEVVVTSGRISKLEIYQRLGVPEVWFVIGGKLSIHALGDTGYALAERSRFAPAVDPGLLERLLEVHGMNAAIEALLEALRTPA